MTTFNDLLNHDDDIIADKARRLVEIKEQRDAGELSQDEAEELTQDLLDLVEAQEITNDLNRNAEIVKAVTLLLKVAKTAFRLM